MENILRYFLISSSLKVNFSISMVNGIRIPKGEHISSARILGWHTSSLPLKFLGVSVRANMNRWRNLRPITDRVKSRLSTLKALTLSFGGRLALVNFFASILPLYYFPIFKAPIFIVDDLEIFS